MRVNMNIANQITQILKRLELIKTSIAIEDQEIIELQIAKLQAMEIDDDVQIIITKLSDNDYATAIADIESYIARYSGVVIYEDKEIGALKMELKVLEQKLQELSEEKNEFLNEINDFNIQYNLQLGEFIRKILELKKELLYRKTILKRKIVMEAKEKFDETQDELDKIKERLRDLKKELDDMDALDESYDDLLEEFKNVKEEYKQKTEELNDLKSEVDELEEEYKSDPEVEDYEEAKQDYEEFSDEYEEVLHEERFELNEEGLSELKKAYRKASKLCHPDMVVDELKEQALALMQQLNEAYSKKDLKKVQEILGMLENGGGFDIASDSINDKGVLKAKIDELRSKINEISEEIEQIKNDDTFHTIQELDDWDNYFSELKSELSQEQEALEHHIKAIALEDGQDDTKHANIHQHSTQADTDYWKTTF